ncbi:MAG: cation-transporting P-type ATPase, partial [Gemmatimonadota bacterium]
MATSRPAANARTAPDPAPDAIGTFWRTPLPELLSALASRPAGLTTAEAEARLARYGPNVLRVGRKRTLPRLFLSRFRSPLVILLVVASG